MKNELRTFMGFNPSVRSLLEAIRDFISDEKSRRNRYIAIYALDSRVPDLPELFVFRDKLESLIQNHKSNHINIQREYNSNQWGGSFQISKINHAEHYHSHELANLALMRIYHNARMTRDCDATHCYRAVLKIPDGDKLRQKSVRLLLKDFKALDTTPPEHYIQTPYRSTTKVLFSNISPLIAVQSPERAADLVVSTIAEFNLDFLNHLEY